MNNLDVSSGNTARQIKKYRTATAMIAVLTEDNTPLACQELSIAQKSTNFSSAAMVLTLFTWPTMNWPVKKRSGRSRFLKNSGSFSKGEVCLAGLITYGSLIDSNQTVIT
jgi:hypothetical protein